MGAFQRLLLCREWELEVKTKAGDLLGKLMVMAWACMVAVTMERREWILEIFWWSVNTYC